MVFRNSLNRLAVKEPEALFEEDIEAGESRRIQVKIPSDQNVKKAIDKLAIFISEDGQLFEEELMRREIEKIPVLNFLKHKYSEEAQYYRWKVFSLFLDNANEFMEGKIFKCGAIWESFEDASKRRVLFALRFDR